MLFYKKYFFIAIASILTACTHLDTFEAPISQLKPDKITEFTESTKIATRMFSSVLTRIENGMLSYTIHRQDNNSPLYLVQNTSNKTIHKLCKEDKTCVGGVFASVHNTKKNKGEILYRVYKMQQIQLACAWLEIYHSKFSMTMTDELQKDVTGRAWHWFQSCFDTI